MTTLEDHPQGQQCVSGLYAAFDPEFQGASFETTQWEDNSEVASWVFIADWQGTETQAGEPLAAGLIFVSKTSWEVGILMWYPFWAICIALIPPES